MVPGFTSLSECLVEAVVREMEMLILAGAVWSHL